MSDAWDFYFARVNGCLASIFVNLGLRGTIPVPGRPWLLWVHLQMKTPRRDGLSSSSEAPTLGEIEDSLTATLSAGPGAELV